MANFVQPDTTDYAAIYNASSPSAPAAGADGDLVAALARLGLTPADLQGASDAVLRALAGQIAGAASAPSAPGSAPGAPGAVPSQAGLEPGSLDRGGRLVVGPNDTYSAPGEAVQWTPATARAWWDNWFANPFPLNTINPQALPGTLVLTPAEIERARIINARLGEDPALAQGQNSGFRPGDTSLNNSYDVNAYLADLLRQQKEGTYLGVNSGQPDPAELARNIAAAEATIAQNKQVFDIRRQQQASVGGPLDVQTGGSAAAGSTGAATPAVQARIAAIPKLQGYIAELSAVKAPTADQQAKLTAYQRRLAEYQSTAAAPSTPPPAPAPAPTASAAPVIGAGSPPPTATNVSGAAPKVDYSGAISKLNTYISNLSAVKQPTAEQQAKLETYKARLADYQSR